MYRRLALAVLVSAIAVGCDSPSMPPTGPRPPFAEPRFDFTNGPSSLPNVFRLNNRIFFAWPDFDRNMAVLINTPADPSDLLACGGAVRPDFVSVQRVGLLQEVLHVLRLAREVNILVFDPAPATFEDLCEATPIASGTGNLTSSDNDLFLTGNGANAFGFRAQGTVELASGGSARVTAVQQLLIKPDGTFEVLVSSVILSPLGGP
jgi:hypothetical protein